MPLTPPAELDGLIRRTVSQILRTLIYEGKLDKCRLDDRDYLHNSLDTHFDAVFGRLRPVIDVHDEFLASAREAVAANKIQVAVVLLAVAVEQNVNTFYRFALDFNRDLCESDNTEIVRNNNIRPKLGWLMLLVSECALDADLRNRILQLMELRNQIVHYKAVPLEWDGASNLKLDIERQDIEAYFQAVEELFLKLHEQLEFMTVNRYGDACPLSQTATETYFREIATLVEP